MTTLFLDNGVPSVKWRDSKNILYTCTEESYNKIFRQALKETKCADHEKEEKVDKLQNKEKKVDEIANTEEINKQEDKEKKLEAYRAEVRKETKDLNDDEINEMKENFQAQIEELKKNLNKEEDKQSKSASLERIGFDDYNVRTVKNSNYEVLTLQPYDSDSMLGDSLLIRMGSTG